MKITVDFESPSRNFLWGSNQSKNELFLLFLHGCLAKAMRFICVLLWRQVDAIWHHRRATWPHATLAWRDAATRSVCVCAGSVPSNLGQTEPFAPPLGKPKQCCYVFVIWGSDAHWIRSWCQSKSIEINWRQLMQPRHCSRKSTTRLKCLAHNMLKICKKRFELPTTSILTR